MLLCNATDPGSKCAKKCSAGGRGRRDSSDHVSGDVHSLVQGLLHIEREKREQMFSGVVDKKVSEIISN